MSYCPRCTRPLNTAGMCDNFGCMVRPQPYVADTVEDYKDACIATLTRRVEDAETELIRAVSHCEEACLAERRALARVEELEAIVAKLPKTADGVPIVPGMFLYELKDGKAVAMESMPCCGFDIAANGRVHLFFQVRKDMERDLIGIYSTEAAALAAKGVK